MKSFLRPLPLAAAAFAALASLPAFAVQPFTANYQASYMGLQANGVMTLAAENGGKWRYTLQVKNQLAELSQSTLFEERSGQLRPLSSHDASVIPFKRRAVDARYDWGSNQATWSGDVKPERRGPVALQSGDMDGLLINLAIARDVAAGKPLNYRMVDDGRAKTLSYRVVGKENMTIDGKTVEATKVSRVDGNKEQIAWIAPGMPVPVRLLQREGGKDALDLTIKSLR
ncbi:MULTISPECIES: DUF3108 domain-containing protein [Stenotrophomonas]|uniref:DUF3108 domain-containing protein n=1 Tax=Stenotrophomonas nitritireducens TaxID=83617 RepID=A0A9D8L1A4_9GAMM|nr:MULTISPECIES: DUF3108 domain-containing protein [Stenotrophomonas]KQN96478.1 hypothetical protein ASF01_14035 [Stenotrophomonas sp. Leaf70]KRG54773.1 hypothetical protein ABB22_15555 [Stenotrophomonas nitritireducens]MBN8792574.1 DUF3108 domain-containing protein [Stenotrophomonas nitritireducens]MBN8796952.1 DUF3108 domain-containing protein [Stenotrophomonas nitritireducens]MBN8799672.1 DUF3108 domain-containing protein [Stenotrophomonas nitritireducens]